MSLNYKYKLIAYRPVMSVAEAAPIGFEYELTLRYEREWRLNGEGIAFPTTAIWDSVSFEGVFSLVNPAVPASTSVEGTLLIASQPGTHTAIRLVAMTLVGRPTVSCNFTFLGDGVDKLAGGVIFGKGWPGPFSDITVPVLGQGGPV